MYSVALQNHACKTSCALRGLGGCESGGHKTNNKQRAPTTYWYGAWIVGWASNRWLRGYMTLQVAHAALQLSGHLRDTCHSMQSHGAANLALQKLNKTVSGCRSSFVLCDVFIHTWSLLHPGTPTWHSHVPSFCDKIGCRDPDDAISHSMSSSSCLQTISDLLLPTAVIVEEQPTNPAHVVPALGNHTWAQMGRNLSHTVSLAGVRAAIHGVAAAAALRQQHELFRDRPYDMVIRLRPDLHRYGVHSLQPDCWDQLLKGVRNGRRAVYACGTAELGNKNTDSCFWGAATAMDALTAAWDGIATREMQRNICLGRYEVSRSINHHTRAHCGGVATGAEGTDLHIPQSAEELLALAVRRANVTSVGSKDWMRPFARER